jgi:hypothetical protein
LIEAFRDRDHQFDLLLRQFLTTQKWVAGYYQIDWIDNERHPKIEIVRKWKEDGKELDSKSYYLPLPD